MKIPFFSPLRNSKPGFYIRKKYIINWFVRYVGGNSTKLCYLWFRYIRVHTKHVLLYMYQERKLFILSFKFYDVMWFYCDLTVISPFNIKFLKNFIMKLMNDILLHIACIIYIYGTPQLPYVSYVVVSWEYGVFF